MRLNLKNAVITGAAQGIGKAIAERFLSEGANVLLSDINREALVATAKELGSPYFVADVSSRDDSCALMEEADRHFTRLDILVNNAGIIHAAELLDLRE